MAFGFGFNKQKVLSAAEKFVQQGKLQNAISEYEKVLKADAKDLTVMNTVGDLYARLGENEKAAECFKNVGDAYAGQGFTVKAIAMYKKLGKLKSSTESVLRLAELYTQQGLFNDARAQYLQVAEDFLKSGKPDQAIRIFQKTLEMDPDNVPMRMRLAEAYVRMGKKDDAWKLLSTAAETLRSKGQLPAANEILQKMLKLDPGNSYALVLRGRASAEAGDYPAAIESLSKVADLDNNPEGLRALFQAYLHSKRFDDALALVTKLANVHSDISAVFEYGNAVVEAQKYRAAVQAYTDFADQLLRADSGKLFESLRALLGYVKDDPQLLEMVLAIFQKGGETTQFTDIYELLAHGYVQSGDLDKARDYYKKLMQLEPANQMHANNYQQVTEQLGTANTTHLITSEEAASLIEELEASAPFIEQRYDDEIALAVKAALTDAELFISYNMPAKALEPLIGVLPKAPRDLRVNQKLAALHNRAGRFAEAGVCCRTLESIYHDAGHAAEAARYSELAAKYEQRSAPSGHASPDEAPAAHAIAPAVQEFQIAAPAEQGDTQHAMPAASVTPAPARSSPTGLFFEAPAQIAPPHPTEEFSVSHHPAAEEFSVAPSSERSADTEVSAEPQVADSWEQDFSVEPPQHVETEAATPEAVQEPSSTESRDTAEQIAPEHAPHAVHAEAHAAPNLQESIEEVRFYLGQGMVAQAELVLQKLEAFAPGNPELAVLRLGIESSRQIGVTVNTEPEISIAEDSVPEISISDASLSHVSIPEASATDAHITEASVPDFHASEVHAAEAPTQPLHQSIEETPAVEVIAPKPQPWPLEREAPKPPAVQPVASATSAVEIPEPEIPARPAAQHTFHEAPAAPGASGKFPVGTLDAFVADLEASLGSDFLPAEADAPAPEPPAASSVSARNAAPISPRAPVSVPVPSVPVSEPPREIPVARAAAASTSSLSASAQPAIPVSPPAPEKIDSSFSVDLSSMFGELKQELEHDVATAEEDPETHYNLGVAFREMGLLDEAIGELQKVCQYVERGRPFPQVIQTYTWLAQCFLDKGVPEVAARWYEKALKLPSLDQETRTALHYELASSLETAGNKPAALSNFLEVYSSNIDYRDVAERIKALRT